MNEKSIQTIEQEIQAICNKHGYTGEVVNLIREVCSYTIYNRNMIAYTLGNESNPDTAVNTNSKIKHALDSSYSVPRGQNCELILTLTRTSDRLVPRYTQLHSYQNYKLYNLDEIESGNVGSTVKIRCIIASKIYKDIAPDEMSLSSHIMKFSNALDVCEQADLNRIDEKGKVVRVTTTQNLTEHIDFNYPLLLTNYNYTLRAYFKDKVYKGNSKDNYTVTAFQYTTFTPAYHTTETGDVEGNIYFNEADSTDGFIRGLSIKGFSIDSIEVVPAVLRESISDIAYTSRYNLVTMTRIRSINDIERVFKEVFKYIVQDCYSVKLPNRNTVIIYYILRNTAARDITNTEWTLFKINNIIKFVPSNFEKQMCDRIDYNIDVKVHSTVEMDKSEIADYIDSLNYSLNRTIRTSEIISQIARLNPNIEYTEVTITKTNGEEIDPYSITIEGNSYLNWANVSISIEVS